MTTSHTCAGSSRASSLMSYISSMSLVSPLSRQPDGSNDDRSAHPVFSWRTTLSATLFNTSPRLRLPSLQADLASALLTYAMALSNFSHSVIASLGAYEYERTISEKSRKEKDERLNFGVTLLCRASGVFSAISEGVLGELDKFVSGGARGWVRPPDLCKEVNAALAKSALLHVPCQHTADVILPCTTGWLLQMPSRLPFANFSPKQHLRALFPPVRLFQSHTLQQRS